ncbi:MAG TPA: PP2C family protein-serine/threonine phosphatase [Terriglobales bacterium]|nr:PP2C family protein-serine/threonine phosphatase [Terriglobales bacterium]
MRRRAQIYWRGLPIGRLSNLLIAVFCLFGMVGCFIDLLGGGQKPLVAVAVWSIFSGFMAAFTIVATARTRAWIVAVLGIWVGGSWVIATLLHQLGPLTRPTPEYGSRVATIACMVLSLAAYVFFIRFIQSEGTRAVRLQTELAIAHGIQTTLVPVVNWRSANLEIYGVSVPSAEVGGDLVDLVALPDGSIFTYVADVSGHGLPAGILMGMIKTAVRTQLFDLPSPTAVFERLNEVLPAVKEPHMYATCTALRIHPAANNAPCRVEYTIAGQPAMLHVSSNGSVSRLEDQQLPLGLIAGQPYEGHQVALQSGDTLLVSTDGILEATDKSGADFGLDRLQQILVDSRSDSLAAIAGRIHDALRSSYAQDDDQSLLLVRLNS